MADDRCILQYFKWFGKRKSVQRQEHSAINDTTCRRHNHAEGRLGPHAGRHRHNAQRTTNIPRIIVQTISAQGDVKVGIGVCGGRHSVDGARPVGMRGAGPATVTAMTSPLVLWLQRDNKIVKPCSRLSTARLCNIWWIQANSTLQEHNRR